MRFSVVLSRLLASLENTALRLSSLSPSAGLSTTAALLRQGRPLQFATVPTIPYCTALGSHRSFLLPAWPQ